MIAGEASGDLHGASFLRALRELLPGVHVSGIGGPKLRAAGMECICSAEALSVVGLPSTDQLRRFWRIFNQLKRRLKENPPGLLILIDFPEFNLLLARVAKRYGVPVFYYISPQIWAWREQRIKVIKRVVDSMAVILPFEVDFYHKHGFEVTFVGHPLLDVVRPALSRETFFELTRLDPTRPLIGIFPGSRRGEVLRHLPLFLETFFRLKQQFPEIQGVIVRAEGLAPELFFVEDSPDLKVLRGYQYEVMNHASALLLASGTVTLEAAIVGTPMVVAYKLAPLSYFLAKHLVQVPYVSLVNLLASKPLVPEILQKEATPDRLAEALAIYLSDPLKVRQLKAELTKVRRSLGNPGAAWRAAELALELLRKRCARSTASS